MEKYTIENNQLKLTSQEIISLIQDINKDLSIKEEQYLKSKKEYNDKLLEIRKYCPHSWSFNSDPSGNNDSYFSCSWCGWERKKML